MEIRTVKTKIPMLGNEEEESYDLCGSSLMRSSDKIIGIALEDTKKGGLVSLGTNGVFQINQAGSIIYYE